MDNSSILQEAEQIIYGDREQTYGSPGKNLQSIAEFWTVHLRNKYDFNEKLTIDDVCQMMILVKMARLINQPTHRDSQVDIGGYIGLMHRVQSLQE